jgi:hypothetical protein
MMQSGPAAPALIAGFPGQAKMNPHTTLGASRAPRLLCASRRDCLKVRVVLLAACALATLTGVPRAQEQPAQEWWSLKPLAQPAIPAVDASWASGWVRNPIDSFVAQRLLREARSPAPEADRATLLRRVMVDLWGLQPTYEEMAAFVNDARPDAYEQLVERLLASPHYGERWARHWMDAAHYAETHGHDQDRPRPNAWPYRDYLINSFNEDKPYGRFIEEQLAADALFPDVPQLTPALGFLATGPWDESSLRDIREDTLDREIARYLDRDDMITTAMSTLISTTVHCARCHDHKFDPVSQEEYYRLQAVFAGVDKAERAYDATPGAAARRRALLARKNALAALAQNADASLLTDDVTAAVEAWQAVVGQEQRAWQNCTPTQATSRSGATLTILADGAVLSSGTRPDKDTYVVALNAPARVTGLRLELLPDDALPMRGPGRQDNGNLHLNELTVTARPRGAAEEAARPLRLVNAQADFNQQGWSIEMALDGNPATAWGIFPEVGRPHQAIFEFADPVAFEGGTLLVVTLAQTHGSGHLIGKFRLSISEAGAPLPLTVEVLPQPVRDALQTDALKRTQLQRATLGAFVVARQIERELAALPERMKVYSATSQFQPDGSFKPAAAPREVRLLRRGEVTQARQVVLPGALDCVAGLESRFALADPQDEAERRAHLARWVADHRNPLTWRSIVNRAWHWHLGRGLVETPNDFGRMGGRPSHPELLDWLALWLQREGGALKSLHRLIVTSSTYRQSSQERPEMAAIDAENGSLWRMNRARLDAETIRDTVLRVSGCLELSMGGPSVKQFIESPGIHVTPNVDYLGFDADRPENFRRSVYRFVFRTLPDPFMETLDCADASQLTPVRAASVTALQALTMLNNKFIVRQSERIAERIALCAADDRGRAVLAFRLVLARDPRSEEAEWAALYASRHGWANVVRMLINSNEFMFVD